MNFLWILLICFFFGILYMLIKFVVNPWFGMRFYNKQGIPTLIFYPFIGYTKLFSEDLKTKGDSLATFKTLRKNEKYKEIVATNLGSDVFLWVVSPSLLKECLLNNSGCFEKIALPRLFKLFGRNQIVHNEGLEWKKSRGMLMNSFSFEILKNSIPIIIEIAEEKFLKIKNAKSVDLQTVFQEFTSQTSMRLFFDKEFSEVKLDKKPLSYWVVHLTEEIFAELFEIFLYIFGEKFYNLGLRKKDRELNHYINVIRKTFVEHIKEKRQHNLEEKNLLSHLIHHQKKTDFDDNRIAGELLVLFFAGTDTTTLLLLNSVYLLNRHPRCLEMLTEEINDKITDQNQMEYDQINNLKYLNAVIKETLRFCGPGLFSVQRYTTKAMKIGNYFIKKNTGIMYSFVSNFYDEDIFSDANSFIPERWLGESGKKLSEINPYIFIPFSAGPRNCIGQHLAMLEAKIGLLKFVKKFQFELVNKEVKYEVKFLYGPSEPLLFDLKPKF